MTRINASTGQVISKSEVHLPHDLEPMDQRDDDTPDRELYGRLKDEEDIVNDRIAEQDGTAEKSEERPDNEENLRVIEDSDE